jgi:hypothetical protein
MEGIAMLSSRFSSNALLVVFVGLFTVLSVQTASANGDRPVFLRFAGDFIQNLEQTVVNEFGIPIATTNLGLIRARVVGNLGSADLTAVSKVENLIPGEDDRCPGGFTKVVEITDNNLVFTFADLSLLYGDGQGVVCINFLSGEQYIAVEGVWLGGTARFRNATGEFSIRFDEFAPVSPNTQVVAESGTITGTLSLDH